MDARQARVSGSAVAVWDRAAQSYDSERKNDPIYASCIKQLVRTIPKHTKCCLDAGCGTGLATLMLRERCEVVVAVDYSFESLEVLKEKKLKNVLIVQADIGALPFRDSTFDASLCANTLQHLKPDGPQEHAVQELCRATEVNRPVALSVHHYSKTKQKAGWKKEGKPGQPGIDYIYRFSSSDVKKMVPNASLRAIGYYRLLRIPYLGRRLQDTVASLIGSRAFMLEHGHMLLATFKNPKHVGPRSH